MGVARRAVVLVLVLAVACGGEDTSGLGKDYPTQLALISQNAHIQDRGLAHELQSRLKRAPASERLDVVEVYVGQAARLYQDVVDALDDLQPLDGIQSAHTAYVQAWQARLELITKVRDAGFNGTDEYLRALDNRAFDQTGHVTETTCEDLQAELASAGRQVDLACAG